MNISRLLKASSLVAGLAAVTCLAQAQSSQVSTSSKQGKKAAVRQKSDAKQATTPVTPSPKKDAASEEKLSAKPESASTEASTTETASTDAATSATAPATPALPEAVALPQGTPFVPDLNLFGPTTAELRQKLATALHNDPSLTGSNIEAVVSDDSISLTGSVRTNKDRVTARRIAESFATNRKVKEKITVAGSGAGTSGQAASDVSNPAPAQKNQSTTPTVQKPETPNRTVNDPANVQEKPKSGE
jgi:hypothetical protein